MENKGTQEPEKPWLWFLAYMPFKGEIAFQAQCNEGYLLDNSRKIPIRHLTMILYQLLPDGSNRVGLKPLAKVADLSGPELAWIIRASAPVSELLGKQWALIKPASIIDIPGGRAPN